MPASQLGFVSWLVLVAALPIPAAAGAQSADELVAFNREVRELYQAHDDAAAPIAAQRYAAASRPCGERCPEYASATAWLRQIHEIEGNYAEAEALCQRLLAMRENTGWNQARPNSWSIGPPEGWNMTLHCRLGVRKDA